MMWSLKEIQVSTSNSFDYLISPLCIIKIRKLTEAYEIDIVNVLQWYDKLSREFSTNCQENKAFKHRRRT